MVKTLFKVFTASTLTFFLGVLFAGPLSATDSFVDSTTTSKVYQDQGTIGNYDSTYPETIRHYSTNVYTRTKTRVLKTYDRYTTRYQKDDPNYCSAYEPLNTQFRFSTGRDDQWVSGTSITTAQIGDRIDVNCFANNGTALLPNAEILILTPEDKLVHTGSELRNFPLNHWGTYSFTCRPHGADDTNTCYDTDKISVRGQQTVTRETTRTRTVVDRVLGQTDTAVACDNLEITSRDSDLAPATLNFQIDANRPGDAREYQIFFGDGQDAVNTTGSFSHTYTQPGTYTVRALARGDSGSFEGGTGTCRRTVSVGSIGKGGAVDYLDEQPVTGASTAATAAVAGSGLLGTALWFLRRFIS